MNISFGKKIPLSQCQIQNKETGNFEKATVYELDCKDKNDIEEIRALGDSWHFNLGMAKDMDRKHHLNKYFDQENDSFFYVLEDENNEILGIAEIEEIETEVYDLRYLESHFSKFKKYIGQALLAVIGEEVLIRKGKSLVVNDAIDTAYDFYANTCGFEDKYGYYLKMDQERINNFIEQTEDRTQALFKDLRA